MYDEIKDALIKALKKIKDIDIIFMRNEDFEDVNEYFYPIIKVISKKTESINLKTESFLIDILYEKEGASYSEYMQMGEKIDEYFSPVFYFENFSIALDAEIKVIDEILHYIFSFSLTYRIENEVEADLMKTLSIKEGE